MGIWDVTGEDERDRWDLVPLEGVGPLRFGATHAEVVAALDGAVASPTIGIAPDCSEASFGSIGLTVYYSDGSLYCIAIDALRGPQVQLNGVPLVARMPSEVEKWMLDQAEVHGRELRYTHAGDPELPELGLISRAQRAGDVVLSRPVFLDQRAEVTWDYVPPREWRVF
ncbi:hypothetical protein GCM10027280_41220 [Micromonospora polyrhachis]|uniref:Uncharacterized protein n=1 Tax=Micromonospora polyrhachis TaxID=1282883 RepID=A0A7W7SNH6_9ACTN|nr:hypothetical protein [Micromonospora polyrhachis]MBB4956820.1 hypothetical protein [Micromonospora polyrhachis]